MSQGATLRASRILIPIRRIVALVVLPIVYELWCPSDIAFAQVTPKRIQPDSASATALDNLLAVTTSGVWNIDGEYKGSEGAYFKLTGYFAYVASTRTSIDDGEAAVLAMYLEPMAGGDPQWLSARLSCWLPANEPGVRCIADQGARAILDLNIVLKEMPFRGNRVHGEFREPDDKSATERWRSRSSSRGNFTLVPPD